MQTKLISLTLTAGLLSAAEPDSTKHLSAAADALKEVVEPGDKSIPQQLLDKAQCLVVVPELKGLAFVLGGKVGKGFVSCRKKGGVGWSAPGALLIEGVSYGLQFGGTVTDVVMPIMNQGGMNRLLSGKLKLGGDATTAAGPLGRSAQAETGAANTPEILTWRRVRGAFLGVSLTGSTVREDLDWNREMYGNPVKNREILAGDTAPPAAASALLDLLNKYSPTKPASQ